MTLMQGLTDIRPRLNAAAKINYGYSAEQNNPSNLPSSHRICHKFGSATTYDKWRLEKERQEDFLPQSFLRKRIKRCIPCHNNKGTTIDIH
jgi:hypothetical protein